MDPTPKPGYTTTEFWITVGNELLALALALLAVAGHSLPDSARAVVVAAAPIAAAIGAAYYAWSRGRVKQTLLVAQADVTMTRLAHEQEEKMNTVRHAQSLELQERGIRLAAEVNPSTPQHVLSDIASRLRAIEDHMAPKTGTGSTVRKRSASGS